MNGNRFFVRPGNQYMQGLNALAQSVQQVGEIKRKEKMEQDILDRFNKVQQEATKAFESGDPEEMHKFSVRNPEWSKAMNGYMQWNSEATRKNYLQSAAELRSNPSEENARRVIEDRQQYLKSQGADQTAETDSFLEQFLTDPDPNKTETLKNLDMMVASVADKDEWNQYKEAAGIVGDDTKPLTDLGKLNQDFKNKKMTKEQYAVLLKRILDGKSDYAPSNLMKMMSEYDNLVEAYGPDHWKTMAMKEKIEGEDIGMAELTDEEKDVWAAWINATGKIPSVGRGKEATALRSHLLKRAADQALKGDIVGIDAGPTDNPVDAAMYTVITQADTKSIQQAMNNLEKQSASIKSFVRNIDNQIERVKDISDQISLTDIRLLNIPFRDLQKKIKGNPALSKYDIYLAEIEREMTKLASGATQSVAAPAVEEIKRWEELIDRNLSVVDMIEVLEEVKEAGDLREESVIYALNIARDKMQFRGRKSKEKESIISWKDLKKK